MHNNIRELINHRPYSASHANSRQAVVYYFTAGRLFVFTKTLIKASLEHLFPFTPDPQPDSMND